jgi:hypothetical protein
LRLRLRCSAGVVGRTAFRQIPVVHDAIAKLHTDLARVTRLARPKYPCITLPAISCLSFYPVTYKQPSAYRSAHLLVVSFVLRLKDALLNSPAAGMV